MKILLLLIAFIGQAAIAAEKKAAACQPLAWPLARSLSKSDVIGEAKKLPRDEAIQYAVGELTRPKQKTPVDLLLLQFLQGTENDKRLQGFFGGIAYLSYGEEANVLLKKWPKVPARVQQLSAERVCQLYLDTLKDPVEE